LCCYLLFWWRWWINDRSIDTMGIPHWPWAIWAASTYCDISTSLYCTRRRRQHLLRGTKQQAFPLDSDVSFDRVPWDSREAARSILLLPTHRRHSNGRAGGDRQLMTPLIGRQSLLLMSIVVDRFLLPTPTLHSSSSSSSATASLLVSNDPAWYIDDVSYNYFSLSSSSWKFYLFAVSFTCVLPFLVEFPDLSHGRRATSTSNF